MPYNSSNNPQKMSYLEMSTEMPRIYQATTKFQIFMKFTVTLIEES